MSSASEPMRETAVINPDRCRKCSSTRVIMEVTDNCDLALRCKDCGHLSKPKKKVSPKGNWKTYKHRWPNGTIYWTIENRSEGKVRVGANGGETKYYDHAMAKDERDQLNKENR